MSDNAAGKIALVTGGNRGIGYTTCEMLADLGFHVILTCRDLDKGEDAANRLRQPGREISVQALDVADPSAVERVRQYVLDTHGRLDVLVNNAGVYLDSGISLTDLPHDMLHSTMATNLYGPLYLCQTFLPIMRKQNYGRVVNVSTDMASLHNMGGGAVAYRMSKAALNALTCVAAREVYSYDVKVNAMSPGWVQSDMGGRSAPRSPEQGADTIIWLATLPKDGPSGGFFRDRKPIAW